MKSRVYSFFLKSRRRIRVSILLLSMFFQLAVLILGSDVSLTSEEVTEILRSFPPLPITWDAIALHNMRVSMFEFLPLFGVWWTGLVGFNTGIALKAIAIRRNQSTSLLFFAIAILPHYWLEDFAYSIALTAGLMLFLALLTLERSIIFYELKCLVASLMVWIILLVLASFLEVMPTFIAFMLWAVTIPVVFVVLETVSEDSPSFSGKTTFLVVLFIYFSLWNGLCFTLIPPTYPSVIAIYVLLGYYLFETLTNRWFRRQIQKFSARTIRAMWKKLTR